MLRISATYMVQRVIEVDGIDSVDDDAADDKIDKQSSELVKKLEGEGWNVSVESLESIDEVADEDDEYEEDEDEDEEDEDEENEEEGEEDEGA
jgi:hypothetical protein